MNEKRICDFVYPGQRQGLALAIYLFVSGMLLVSDTQATKIYKSIDAYGNVTYSSFPPLDATLTERIEVPTNFDVDTEPQDTSTYDEIKAAGKVLEEDRKQREQEREAARKKLEEEDAKKQAQIPPRPVIRYYPLYPIWHHRHGRHKPPHHPPRPRPHPPRPQPQPPIPAPQPKPLPR